MDDIVYISKELLENKKWEEFLDVKGILEDAHNIPNEKKKDMLDGIFYVRHHKTTKAMKEQYQERKKLGFIPSEYSTNKSRIGIWIDGTDKSILRQAFVKRIKNNTVIDGVDSNVSTVVCQTMYDNLGSLFCCEREYYDRMDLEICQDCGFQASCLSYKLYELISEEINGIRSYSVPNEWKAKLKPSYLAGKINDNNIEDIQNCIRIWFDETVVPNILENYNTERLLKILKECEINEQQNLNLLQEKIDEYMKTVYGETVDKEEVLALIEEKVLPELGDGWLDSFN